MSFITPNSFFHASENTTSNTANPPITIFFITGNPGLIGYYYSFLSLLASRLASTFSPERFQVYGHSLAGFELDDPNSARAYEQEPHESSDDCYDLEEQICFVQRWLDAFISRNGCDNSNVSGKRPKVILIGHSVGAYIAMEVLRRHRERQQAKSDTNSSRSCGGSSSKTNQSSHASTTASVEFDIIGGVMLFPTVVDIAKSPAGQELTVRHYHKTTSEHRTMADTLWMKIKKLLNIIPQLALMAAFFARLLTALMPGGLLHSLVAAFMGLSPSASVSEKTVVETTCGFLRSKRGVRQALHLGADEMQTITYDKWTDDIWGMPSVREPLAKLFFYFGRNDHWVAERTRDEIISMRGRNKDGPRMVVCEDGLPHAFCLSKFLS